MTLKEIDSDLGRRGLVLDLRAVDDYLAGHAPGSVSLLFEDGPGFSGRARDLLPLDARLILYDDGSSPLDDAAAMLRGKGFDVVGSLRRGGPLVTTEVTELDAAEPLRLLNVADPGVKAPDNVELIPAELLWTRASELGSKEAVGVLAGWGVRAATAVGILERIGFRRVAFVRTLPAGSMPPTADKATLFRVLG